MSWYKTGSISVTNGNATIYGSGTSWVDSGVLNAGDIISVNSVLYEILSIQSNTQLTLAANYLASTASGLAYAIMPIGLLPSALALQVKTTLSTANTALASAVRFDINSQSMTTTQQQNARTNIGALGASDVGFGLVSVSVAGNANVTLNATQSANEFIELTGALTGAISVIVPAQARHYFIANLTSGSFALTVKTPSGAGVVVPQGGRMLLECNGTDVINPQSAAAITAGSIDNTPIGATTPAAGTFTALTGATIAGGMVATLADMAAGTAANKAATPSAVVNYLSNVWGLATAVNDIGVPGAIGFGVGICPEVPAGFTPLAGHTMPASDTYGNYQYSDGSVMVYIPAFWYKYGTGSNGFAINQVDIKPYATYANESAANAAGYAIHRAFYNGGAIRRGVFVDKYLCSNSNNIASSIKHGIPLASGQRGSIAATAFSSLTGAPANAYYGAIAAAKTRGSRFFCNTRFIRGALALLSLAHGNASTSSLFNGWYSSGSTNFPKGCNNNALGDANDGALTFVYDGNGTYTAANKTGSANYLDRTTHNGQTCGIADLNGTLWEIELGLTSDGSNYYLLKTAADVGTITGGNTTSTDAWGASGLSALYDNIGATYESMTASSSVKYFGSSNQVLSAALSGNAWNAAGAGIPLVGGTGGSNQFGSDGLWDYRPNELCVISGGTWASGSDAGVWTLNLGAVRGTSYGDVGFRAASFV